jgi:hypothetical protein
MCGVLLRSGSRSLGRHFRHLARRTTTTSLAKPLKRLGPNLLFRLSIVSDGAAAQQLLISVFGREMYISQWWLVYLSLELLFAPCSSRTTRYSYSSSSRRVWWHVVDASCFVLLVTHMSYVV